MRNLDYFNILPPEITSLPQFILWKYEIVSGKKTKVPYQPDGNSARVNDRNTFSSFPTVVKYYKENQEFDGIGFVFTKEDDFVGIDIDHCVTYKEDDISKENPIYNDLANEIMELTDSYVELSPSRTGIHIIVKGDLPLSLTGSGRKNSSLGLELYRHSRYFTISFDKINENPIYERTDELTELFEKYFSQPDDIESSPADLSKYAIDEIRLSNSELWEKMFQSRSGAEIQSLYKGELIDGDHSSSDLALCNHLAFWTGKSATRMDSMFRESGLMRDKWDLKRGAYLYGEMTIAKSIASTSTTILDYKSVDDSEFKFNFNKVIPEKDLKTILQQRHWDELNEMQRLWMEDGEKGRMPMALTPKHCADILQEYIKFILFDLDENTRLSMYVGSEGIYTSNTQYIKRVISWLEPKLNDRNANDVIYHITNDAEIMPRTESRFLIPVQNGVFNLKTKELEPFTWEYVFTSKIATEYHPQVINKEIDGWDVESWLDSIACNDKQISNLLWQVINEALNGNYTRKKSIFLLGDGNNGKGTFQDLLINLIGFKNVANLRVNEFDERFKLSLLEGKTVVIGDDVQAGINIDDSANFNSVVTGDSVQVEQKNKPMYNTVYRCAVIQSTNGMPTFKNKTSGTMRRLIIVPFNADFNNEQENFDIKEVYIKDKQVLEYVLHKAINMDFERFDIPDASIEKLDEFEVENDPIIEFKKVVFDHLDLKEMPMKFIYILYQKFCNENGIIPEKNRTFMKRFKKNLHPKWTDGIKRMTPEEIEKLAKIHYDSSMQDWNKIPCKILKTSFAII